MLNVQELISRGLALAECNAPILAAPFDLTSHSYEEFLSKGTIAGAIANRTEDFLPMLELSFVGHWTNRNLSRLCIDKPVSDNLLFLGVEQQISGRMLWELRRKGIQHVIYLSDSGSEFEVMSVKREFKKRFLSHTYKQAASLPVVKTFFQKRLNKAGISFEDAFKDLRDNATFLALPRESFNDKKLVIVTGGLGPGGAERQINNTATGLASRSDYDIVVAGTYLDAPGDFYKQSIENAGVRVECMAMQSDEFATPDITALKTKLEEYTVLGFQNILHHIVASAVLLREERPAHVHCWMDATNICTGIAAQLVGVPHITLSGRSVAPDNFEIFQPYMRPGYLDLLANGSPQLLNNSRAGANDYARWLGINADIIKVIPNGFDFPDRPDNAAIQRLKKPLGIDADRLVLGSIIRFSEEKRPKLLIDTAAIVLAKNPRTVAVFFGGGVMLEDMRKYVEKIGFADRIFLPGMTDKAFLAMASFDVFLLTSRLEGLPNVLIEAQAMGVPVVTTGKGGMPETYIEGETGFSVSQETGFALAQSCLDILASDKKRETMGQKAFIHARKYFGMDNMIKLTKQAYVKNQ